MPIIHELSSYADEHGNSISYQGRKEKGVRVKFTGSNNTLTIDPRARIESLIVDFDCDNGVLRIGGNDGAPPLRAAIRVGQDSVVSIGRNVSMTSVCAMSATEGAHITIGDDVMFASENQVRADDGHPIFDVRTGLRANPARSITIGAHVWLGRAAVVLGGAKIGSGSVIGYGSIVTKSVPNNCIAAGVPAKIVRRDIAWERPHLSLVAPFYKPDASTITKSSYWHLTEGPSRARGLGTRRLLRRVGTRLIHQLRRARGSAR